MNFTNPAPLPSAPASGAKPPLKTFRQFAAEQTLKALAGLPEGVFARVNDLHLPFGESTLRAVVRELEEAGRIEATFLPSQGRRPSRGYRLAR